MDGKTFGIGALLIAAGAIATDARSWLVGKLLDAITPEGGWSGATVFQMPWGSIIGVPVFIGAAAWLLWESFGRASFRARFGTDRALTEFVLPLTNEIVATNRRIDNLYSALKSLKDRERLKKLARDVEDTARPMYNLVAGANKLRDGQELLLRQFEGDWTLAYARWMGLARSYDERLIDNLIEVPADALKGTIPEAEKFCSADSATSYRIFCARMESWRQVKQEIMSRVEDTAFGGEVFPEETDDA